MSLLRPADDIQWEALAAFLSGELSEGERHVVDRWLADDPRHEELLAVLRRGWEASAGNRRRYDTEAALRQMKERAGVRGVVKRHPGTGTRRALLAASVAALAVGSWWVASHVGSRPTGADSRSVVLAEYQTRRGQRLTLKLPDGVSIMLGPASTLRLASAYAKGYAGASRAVELEGEAYFTVPHDAAHPFSVRTPRALIRDLGTHFVVQAYAEEQNTDVVVTEGLVAVGRSHASREGEALSAESLVVARGQRGRLTDVGELKLTSLVAVDTYLDWTEGRLVFRDTPLPEALRQIGRWYDVRIRLMDTRFAGRTLTAVFRDESASEVARLVAAPFGLQVERDVEGGFVLRPAAQ